MNILFTVDSYKMSHQKMLPKGCTLIYGNCTSRSNKYAPKGCDKVVSFGQQLTVKWLKQEFDKFFKNPNAVQEIKQELELHYGTEYDSSHFESLHKLGYLPLHFKSLPEGTLVPIGVPMMTWYNTHPDFAWLTLFVETPLSTMFWKLPTSATIAFSYKKILSNWANKTDKNNIDFVDFQGHDFSARGMSGIEATWLSGLGHLTSFKGSDTLSSIPMARKYYNEKEFVSASVPATEHSVMCAGTKDDEVGTFRYLMKQFPTGILSIVSDTWDLWKVLTEILPELKDEILARDGKIVIRPDSGDPVDIVCGTSKLINDDEIKPWELRSDEPIIKNTPSEKGVIELLWDLFGGTINEQGYKVLDPHIGAIYGDSITIDRAEEICKRLEAKGFASTNIVLGVGSFTYQYNTRDTFGFAMKATYCEINHGSYYDTNNTTKKITENIESREIFKDPITDDGTKKSAKGLLHVGDFGDKGYILSYGVDWESEETGALQTIFKNGDFYNKITLTQIRNNLNGLI